MFLQIIYISTMRTKISAEQVRQILKISRRNNARDEITGLLVVGGSRFLQLLEGPAVPVRAAYERIRADDRHFASVILADKAVEARQCPNWAMGHVAGDVPYLDKHVGQFVEQLVLSIQDANLRAEFTGFIKVQSNAA